MLRSFTRRTAINHRRCFSSPRSPENSIQFATDLKNPQNVASPPPPTAVIHHHHRLSVNNLSPLPSSSSSSRGTVLAVSATVLSAIAAASYVVYDEGKDGNPRSRVLNDLEHAVDRSNESLKRIVNTMKQTGVAASVLWKSLRSVMSTANHEVRSGFEVRVAALLADIVAANEVRRAAIVGAGGGVVLDWLLDTVALSGGNYATQAESARALAYLIADPNVSEAVLGRPHAIPNLLRFIFSAQPHRSKKQTRRSSFDISDPLKGRSMLVAAIMDIVTSNCGNVDNIRLKPVLPGNALMRDIAAALEVVEEGGMHLDEPRGGEEDEDGGTGIKGIGIKVLGGTTVLGFSRSNGLIEIDHSDTTHLTSVESTSRTPLFNKINDDSPAQKHLSSAVIPGLWDDLHSQHVAVPFAAWALANWAMASGENRSHIQELDRDGHAVTTALIAPERSVKWHGSLVAKSLLQDRNLPLNGCVSDWSSSLLSTISQASKTDDVLLAEVALSAVLLSMERSPDAQKAVMKKGLSMMRETAKRMMKHRPVQEALAYCLESLCAGDMQLPLDEGQKWSSILLSWVFEKSSSENMRSSAINILSHILEDYGPLSIPISQGWLDILLNEVLEARKSSLRGSPQPRSDKVKTQVDQANVVSATQTAKEMAGAVVNLAVNQLGTVTDFESFPLADLLSLEPFVGPYKNLKKDDVPKINAADSALATLKGIKALTEICCVDSVFLNKIVDCGVITLLRQFLLQDDYEKLAAAEAYDASRDLEAQDHTSVVPSESTRVVVHDPSSLRVPSTAHIRRHAARLLTVLSVLPKVKSIILEDKTWCKWLEECASGRIPGCNDLKIQSYARATLLNIACNDEDNNKGGVNSVNSDLPHSKVLNKKQKCPQYTEMIFLISPELPHWKSPTKEENSVHPVSAGDEGPTNCENSALNNVSSDESMSITRNVGSHFSNDPSIDVVFVHGIRGGPYKTWRLSECKSSSKSGLIEKIDEEAGKQGTFWPGEWLSADLPHARMFTLKYKTNLTQWSGASLPLQEVSSMLLEKLVAAGIGDRPVVFVTHSMGGLVVKQILYKASAENIDNLVNNTVGMVFYSCPHFGSRLADMPWRMGLVFRPAPTIGELRSGSPRLVELNDFIRGLHKKRMLEVLSFCETKVTPIVEGYGGWAFRMEIVPIESAYPGFGELVVLDATDHVNSCKPISRTDPSYKETLDFLNKLRGACT